MSTELHCHRCGALAPPGAEWCSLCYADLRAPRVEHSPAEPEVRGSEEVAHVRRGRHARPASDVVEAPPASEVEAAAAAMLAQLAASESGAPLGRWSGLVDSPGKKVGLMVGGTVAAMVVLVLAMATIGALL